MRRKREGPKISLWQTDRECSLSCPTILLNASALPPPAGRQNFPPPVLFQSKICPLPILYPLINSDALILLLFSGCSSVMSNASLPAATQIPSAEILIMVPGSIVFTSELRTPNSELITSALNIFSCIPCHRVYAPGHGFNPLMRLIISCGPMLQS